MPDVTPFTVLCVDDSEANRQSLTLVLQSAGHRVLEADTGEAALRLASQADLVVLDVRLPDINGMTVCQRIKADPATALTPVILLSGFFTASEYRAEGLEGGADAYLTKPVDPRELLGQIKALLRIRQAEAALLASERRYRQIVETASEGIWVIDADGRTTFANQRLAEMLGFPAEQLLGRGLFEFTADESEVDDGPVVAEPDSNDGQPEFRFRRRDGCDFWALVSASPLPSAGGHYAGSLLMVTDVTERRKLEEQTREALKMEAVGRLAGGIAHDFNNLLTVITGYSELIQLDVVPGSPTAEFIAQIRAAADRAAALTRQLLAFGRRSLLVPRVLNLGELVQGMERVFRRLLGEAVTLVIVTAPGLYPVRVDPVQMEQALVAVAANARDAMPEGGTLTIQVRNVELADDGPFVLLAMSDTGVGMDETIKARIFEPFYTTKGVGKGTGLGLSMVYGFMLQSGGRVEVDSGPGAGATFLLYLPSAETSSPRSAELAPLPRGSEIILLVDPNDGLRGLARRTMQSCGYMVLEAADRARTLELAASHDGLVHLLVVGPGMPGTTGQELADALHRQRPQTRVLFLSGSLADETGLTPFSPSGLAEKVRAALDRCGP